MIRRITKQPEASSAVDTPLKSTLKTSRSGAKNIFSYVLLILLFFLPFLFAVVFYTAPDESKHDVSAVTNEKPSSKDVSSEENSSFRFEKSHMLSLEPLRRSLHADWQLWEEMNSVEQDEAIKKVGPYLTKYGKLLGNRGEKIKHGTCELVEFSTGHALCGPKLPSPCTFLALESTTIQVLM